MRRTKRSQMKIRVPEDVRKMAEKYARANRWSLNTYVGVALEEMNKKQMEEATK